MLSPNWRLCQDPREPQALVRPQALAKLADLCPNFVAIKYAITNPVQFATTVQIVGKDRLAWICGVAESWAPLSGLGAVALSSGLVNLTTDFSLGMLTTLAAGDYAQAMSLWNMVRPFEESRGRHHNGNNVSVVKEAMAQMGLCNATVRPPISELTHHEKVEVTQILEQFGLTVAAQEVEVIQTKMSLLHREAGPIFHWFWGSGLIYLVKSAALFCYWANPVVS